MKKLLYILCVVPHIGYAMSLHDACYKGELETVQKILDADENRINKRNERGCSPIHAAAFGGSSEVIKLLLNKKPDLIDEADEQGNVPFIHLFWGIIEWREKLKDLEMIEGVKNLGFIHHKPHIIDDSEFKLQLVKMRDKQFKFKEIIEIFVSRRACLDTPNNYGNKWSDIPGLEKEELADYARKHIDNSKTYHFEVPRKSLAMHDLNNNAAQ